MSPSEPDPGDAVRIRLRAAKNSVSRAVLFFDAQAAGTLMTLSRSDDFFDYYDVSIVCSQDEVRYHFLVETPGGAAIAYDKSGPRVVDVRRPDFNPAFAFRFIPGFHVPAWSKGALQYQIFPDRFRNGCPENDVVDNEYYYTIGTVRHMPDWDEPPSSTDFRCFYGGDLQGIIESLDYLQSLGVKVLYLNPVFVSPSSHKYDCQDYGHIDPHFGVIVQDADRVVEESEKSNAKAEKYIRRVTSMENLEQSDLLFAALCHRLHERGMRIILDGVFNHCGSFNKWMDAEGIYSGRPGFEPGAYRDPGSPYRSYFRFTESYGSHPPAYEGWWGYSTLPKLNYEDSPELREEIYSVAEKWLSPPYSVDGWRLDVAADLGHSQAFNHAFWKEFRNRVKAINPDALIIAEHYGDPSPWLNGQEWDSVMNYDAFMEPVSWFLTGMEKHSDSVRDDLYQNGSAFFGIMRCNMARFTFPSLMCAMNELSNHDHSRFLTRTNRMIGRAGTLGPGAAGAGICKDVFREAVVIQMSWPGAPTVYYADEAGQVGWTDPDNRRTYPWGHEDASLIALHGDLARLRDRLGVLSAGSLKELLADYGRIAYARFDENVRAVVAVNNLSHPAEFRLFVRDAGAPEGEAYFLRIRTGGSGHVRDPENESPCLVQEGFITVSLPPLSAAILANRPAKEEDA